MSRTADAMICGCSTSYRFDDGVLILNKNSNYYGEVKQDHKESILERMRSGEHWRNLIWKSFHHNYTFLHHIIVDETRNDFSTLLPLAQGATVLDLGAGWGTTSCHFAHRAELVYSLDGILDRCKFIQLRCEQDGVGNVRTICANILDRPFAEHSFDIVLMNGVLEWVGTSIDGMSAGEAQLAALKEVRRILKPEGVLYVGIENSHGYRYILGGDDDHTGLPHITYHVREKADEVAWKRTKKDYRTFTYDMAGYHELLEAAGFESMEFFYPYPDYKHVQALFPLDDVRPLQFYYRCLHKNVDAETEVERVRSLELRAAELGHVAHNVASYGIVAGGVTRRKGLIHELLAYARDNPGRLFGAESTEETTFLQISGTQGKVFTKGRLKIFLQRGEIPEWVAIASRDKEMEGELEREVAILCLPALREAVGFSTPEAFLERVGDRQIQFQRLLPGQSMSTRLANERYRAGYAPDQLFALADSHLNIAGQVLAELRERTASTVPTNTLGPDGTEEIITETLSLLRELGLSANSTAQIIDRFVDSAPTLFHGDFTPWNCLLDESGTPGLLDWELAGVGRLGFMDALRFVWGTLFDVSQLATELGDFDTQLAEALVTGGHPLTPGINHFLRQSLGVDTGSSKIKGLMRFFLAREALLQIEHSLTVRSAILDAAHERARRFED
jgi:ubiquinone/menaquinone biosynthesis C-methylase UbiE